MRRAGARRVARAIFWAHPRRDHGHPTTGGAPDRSRFRPLVAHPPPHRARRAAAGRRDRRGHHRPDHRARGRRPRRPGRRRGQGPAPLRRLLRRLRPGAARRLRRPGFHRLPRAPGGRPPPPGGAVPLDGPARPPGLLHGPAPAPALPLPVPRAHRRGGASRQGPVRRARNPRGLAHSPDRHRPRAGRPCGGGGRPDLPRHRETRRQTRALHARRAGQGVPLRGCALTACGVRRRRAVGSGGRGAGVDTRRRRPDVVLLPLSRPRPAGSERLRGPQDPPMGPGGRQHVARRRRRGSRGDAAEPRHPPHRRLRGLRRGRIQARRPHRPLPDHRADGRPLQPPVRRGAGQRCGLHLARVLPPRRPELPRSGYPDPRPQMGDPRFRLPGGPAPRPPGDPHLGRVPRLPARPVDAERVAAR